MGTDGWAEGALLCASAGDDGAIAQSRTAAAGPIARELIDLNQYRFVIRMRESQVGLGLAAARL